MAHKRVGQLLSHVDGGVSRDCVMVATNVDNRGVIADASTAPLEHAMSNHDLFTHRNGSTDIVQHLPYRLAMFDNHRYTLVKSSMLHGNNSFQF